MRCWFCVRGAFWLLTGLYIDPVTSPRTNRRRACRTVQFTVRTALSIRRELFPITHRSRSTVCSDAIASAYIRWNTQKGVVDDDLLQVCVSACAIHFVPGVRGTSAG